LVKATLAQLNELMGQDSERVYVDMGYQSFDYEEPIILNLDKRRRGRTPKNLWHWMKRGAAIEPTIGHPKALKRPNRNRLKGIELTA
jgi:IS5 family transposase